MDTRERMTAKTAAKATYPIPQASPTAMARNTAHISLAVPGADLNLTSEKAPATATEAPMLPLTIMIITATIAGSMATVIRNPLE